MRFLLSCLIGTLLFAAPLRAEEAAEEEPQAHTDRQIKEHEVFEKLEVGLASDDVDVKLLAIRNFGRWRHKKVLKELKKLWLKNPDMEVKAVAAGGLAQQTPFAKDAAKALIKGLEAMEDLASREEPDEEEEILQLLEARAIVAGLEAVGVLGYKDGWKALKGFIDHHDDEVAGAMMLMCGSLQEYRALPVLLEWFNFYPNGYSYEGGSVRVDTGAAGNKDAKAAKAKWKAKYGRRARKARPAAWEKLIQSLEMITGVKFEKPEELKDWMKENKALLRRHGV